MKIPKQVTERDFRKPEFMDADPNDYEVTEKLDEALKAIGCYFEHGTNWYGGIYAI